MNLQLSLLATALIQTQFTNYKCVLLFRNAETAEHYVDLIISNVQFVNVLVEENGTFDKSVVFNHFGCQGVIFHLQKPVKTFSFFEEVIRRGSERYNWRRFIFLPATSGEDAMDVFNTELLHFVADVLVVVPKKKAQEAKTDVNKMFDGEFDEITFQLFSHKFIGVNSTNDVILMDEWFSGNQSFLNGNNLFPDKLHNGYGKSMRLATFTYKPYSVPDVKEGIELQVALLFCERYNYTADLLIDEEGEWGDIYENYTGFGLMGNILSDAGDVGLGALYSWENAYVYLDFTKPIVRTGITCLTPKPKLAGGWLVPFISFTPMMWIAVGFTFFGCCAVQFLVEYYVSKIHHFSQHTTQKKVKQVFEDSVLYTAAIFLLQSVPQSEITKTVKRYLYATLLIYALLLTTVYSSGLASSMTIPRYVGAIKTVEDLVQSGIQWGATSTAWLMSISDAQEENYKILLDRFVSTDEDTLKYNNDKRFAFSLERLSAGYFAIGEYVTREGVQHLRLMSEDIYWEHCVFMTRKSSIYTPILDQFILQMSQSGIPSLWEYKVATTHLDAHVQRAVKFSTHHSEGDGSPKMLKTDDVEGAFGLLIIGNVCGTLCFIFEIIKHRKILINN